MSSRSGCGKTTDNDSDPEVLNVIGDLTVGGVSYLGSSYPFTFAFDGWTPSIDFYDGTGTPPVVTEQVMSGKYARLGPITVLSFHCLFDYSSSLTTWNIQISGVPSLPAIGQEDVMAPMCVLGTELGGLAKVYFAATVSDAAVLKLYNYTGTEFNSLLTGATNQSLRATLVFFNN